jgi:hypothetical protein
LDKGVARGGLERGLEDPPGRDTLNTLVLRGRFRKISSLTGGWA